MVAACGIYGRGRDHFGDVAADYMIILKRTFRKWCMRVWMGFTGSKKCLFGALT
jgi:hypothetical protein